MPAHYLVFSLTLFYSLSHASQYRKYALNESIFIAHNLSNDRFFFFKFQATMKNGRRWSTNTAFLFPPKRRPNLHFKILSAVTRILIDRETKTAIGVEFVTKRKKYRVFVRKEVIVSGGSINFVAAAHVIRNRSEATSGGPPDLVGERLAGPREPDGPRGARQFDSNDKRNRFDQTEQFFSRSKRHERLSRARPRRKHGAGRYRGSGVVGHGQFWIDGRTIRSPAVARVGNVFVRRADIQPLRHESQSARRRVPGHRGRNGFMVSWCSRW